MKTKNIIFLILWLFLTNGVLHNYAKSDNEDDFIESIDTDEKGNHQDQTNLEKKRLHDKTYFGNLMIEFPKEEYAKDHVAWLTTDKALEFNATEGMDVNSVEKYFNYYTKYSNDQISKGRKLNHYIYFVKNKITNELVGNFQIDNIDYHSLEGTLRFVVATKLENNGYGTKLMRIMLEKSFDDFGLYRVIGTVALDNIGSIKIFEKFGFKRDGILREYYVVKDGKRIDMILFSLLKHEWENFKKNEKNLIKYKNL